MSFLSSVKRAFGFPGEYDGEEDDDFNDDELTDDPDLSLEAYVSDQESGNGVSDNAEPSSTVISDEELKELASDIFDSVLGYFNSHQPEVVRKCIDIDTQRSILLQEIDENLKTQIAAIADRACRAGENMWADKQQRMGAELLKLKSEYNAVRQQREEIQSAQLSATRQKRALSDRIRDLEAQVMTLEAEREQYQLENRSMAARLRGLPSAVNLTPASSATDDATARKLKSENETLKKEIESLRSKAESAEAEIARLKEEISQNCATGVSAEEIAELKEIERQMERMREAKETSEANIISLNKEIKESDATIAQLQKQLADSAKEAESAYREIESLRSTIESNLYAHAAAEAELKAEISRLKEPMPIETSFSETAETKVTQPQPQPQKKKNRKNRRRKEKFQSEQLAGLADTEPHQQVKISAIDELMDSTDWFVAPEPIPLKKDPEVEENFGYKEPAKKPDVLDDDRQLTLW